MIHAEASVAVSIRSALRPVNCCHRLAYRIQELAYGGLSRPARRELSAVANGAVPQAVTRPKKPPRIQPGTRLVRT